MKNKRLVGFMLSILLMMTVFFTACSSGGDEATKETDKATAAPVASSGATKAPEEAVTAPPETAHEPVTLKLISWSDSYTELYKKFNEKYPWITIEQIPVNSRPVMEIIATLEAAGTPADLTWIDSDLITFDQNGLIEDLTPYLEKDTSFRDIQLPTGFFDTMTYKGKKLAAPFVDVPMWILVNKDLLTKHGVEMPKNDWSYDDFRDVAKKLTDPDAGEYGLTTQPEFQMRLLSTKAVADGHAANLQFMNADLTQSVLNTPEVINDVKWLQDFVTKDGSMQSYAAAKEKGDVSAQFINGKTGFAIGGDWVLPGLKKDAKFAWDVLPFPKGKVSQPGYTIYGPLSLLSGSKHKEEAYLWISFQFSKEAQKWKIDQGANASVIDPELTAYYDQSPMWQGKNIEAVKIAQKNAVIQPGATVPAWGEYNWNNIMNDVVMGEGDINLIIPETEAWNKKTLEVRDSLK
ncbi:extracellular solute-binding protein [Paenibacillus psychroresistens]|uniref:Extracellular solute-binding protein n=1 Tax=Paenibacillus psychroresistens TaxID=1778678 RepID=A0A6B8RUK1_9BACL|nr:extracellular solute-binding protein [Paenibacillus psychroresistens]QGQ98966.1 extracellular solute-binding protein [Paenibacillus psychroresistens]